MYPHCYSNKKLPSHQESTIYMYELGILVTTDYELEKDNLNRRVDAEIESNFDLLDKKIQNKINNKLQHLVNEVKLPIYSDIEKIKGFLEPKTLQGHTNTVWSLAVLNNGNIVSGSNDKTIRIWFI